MPKRVTSADDASAHQAVIVDWMQRQMKRLGWRPETWAKAAGLAPTTVSRAISPGYASVSSVPTVHALAVAAQVPSVLDFLAGRAGIAPGSKVLCGMLVELLPAIGCRSPEAKVERLAHALSVALAGWSELSDGDELEHAKILARAARHTIRDLNHD